MRVPQVSERIKEAPAQALRGVFAGIGQLLLVTDKIRNKASHQDVPRAKTPQASATVTDTTVTSPADQGAAAPAKPTAAKAARTAPAAAKPTAARRAPAKPAAAKPTMAKPAAAKPTMAKPTAAKPAAGKPVTSKPATKPSTPRPTAAKAAAAGSAASAGSAGEAAPKPAKPQSSRDLDKTGNVRLLSDGADGSAVAPAVEAPLPNYGELSVASLRARLRNLDVTQVRQLAEYERAHAARADVVAMFERRIAKLEAEA
jgi:hypothetical protein